MVIEMKELTDVPRDRSFEESLGKPRHEGGKKGHPSLKLFYLWLCLGSTNIERKINLYIGMIRCITESLTWLRGIHFLILSTTECLISLDVEHSAPNIHFRYKRINPHKGGVIRKNS